jgi:hypothetical protein
MLSPTGISSSSFARAPSSFLGRVKADGAFREAERPHEQPHVTTAATTTVSQSKSRIVKRMGFYGLGSFVAGAEGLAVPNPVLVLEPRPRTLILMLAAGFLF